MGLIVVIVLLGLLGYLLGVIGFFRAGAALRETRQLRKLLSQEIAKRNAEGTAASPSPDSAVTIDAVVPIDDAPQSGVDPVIVSTAEPAVETAPDPFEATPPKTGGSSNASGQHDFESVLATRWGVWLGAVALLLAGVFLVRYAAEHAVLGPAARCWAAVGLGIALIAGAEWTARRDKFDLAVRLGADQAPAALAAGGVATLFGASYGAGPFYGLLPPLLAFAAMAASSFLGLLAALRFGPLTAAVGIVGAFAAPALVTTQDPSLVGTFLYLLFATAGAHAVVRRTAWTWLAWAVTIAGAAWILAATLVPDDAEIWAPAAFVPLSALIGLLLLPAAAMDASVGRWLAKGQFAMIASAGLAFEAMVPGVTARTAVFALSPVAAWYGARESRLDGLPWLAAACGLVVLYFWDGMDRWDLSSAWYPSNVAPETQDARSILAAAFAFAAAYATLGLWQQARAVANRTRWAALAAAVPVLTLAVCYWTVGQAEADPRWGFAGLLLAAMSTGTTAVVLRRSGPILAGVHAAGAVAALALAIATTAHDQWLTTALAIVLPGLAWVAAKVELPSLRAVALVVVVIALVLLGAWLPYDFLFGHRTVVDHPFVTYAIPAAAFALAARLFRHAKDDRLVAVLEAGAIGSTTLFVTIEVRLWFGDGDLYALIGFDEAVIFMLATMAQAFAYHLAAHRTGRSSAKTARTVLAGVAALPAGALIVADPIFTGASVKTWSIAGAYLVPGAVAAVVSRLAVARKIRPQLAGYALVAGLSWITLQVRSFFHPESVSWFVSALTEAELWTLSGAWLAYGLGILAVGVRLGDRGLRLTGLALVGIVCAKVFLIDMAELTGLWRVASFLGLGLALIGLGSVHRRFVLPRLSADDD